MAMTSAMLVLVAAVSVLDVARACDPCTTEDFPPCLGPTIGTTLEPLTCVVMKLVSGLESDLNRVVCLVLIALKMILEVLQGLDCNVKELLDILTRCYGLVDTDPALSGLLGDLLDKLKGVLKGVVSVVGGLLSGGFR